MTLGSIGNDRTGKIVKSIIESEKLLYSIHEVEDTLTGQCAVSVVNVDRTCIAILDACEKYPTEHIKESLNKELLKDTFCFYSTGFFIESNSQALFEMAKYANTHNRIFSYNFAADYIFDMFKP